MSQPALFEEPVTLRRLESHLWQAANILRGSPVDRTDWKSYILPLLFFKRICDVWDEEYRATVELYGEDFADGRRFQIPDGCHWRSVRETPSNVGLALQNAMRGIEAANQGYNLSIPLYVKRAAHENGHNNARPLPELWAEWEQQGRLFWQEMDALVEMLDNLEVE